MYYEGIVVLILFWPLLRIASANQEQPPIDHFKEAESMYDRINDDLKNKYDRRIRPWIGVKPVEVDIFIYVSSLRSISEATMDYKLELYFREYWQDPRMQYDPARYRNMSRLSLHESYADLIWVPDTFLPNAVHSENPDHRSITHRALLRLEPDGHLLYSRRLSVTAECPMDLSLYPFGREMICNQIHACLMWYQILDQQVCMLSIESYGYGTDDIVYRWVENDPIVVNQNLQLPDFKIKHVLTKSHNVTLATGTYSRLEACFFFVRSSAFYFVQLFIPATAIVITSWLSLWMEGESTFSDMVEVILAITFLYYSYNTMMPRVSYIKAMDIYLGACFVFVFLSLIKLAILKMMRMHGERLEWRRLRKNNSLRRSLRTSPLDSSRKYKDHNKNQYCIKNRWADTSECENCLNDDEDTLDTVKAYSHVKNPMPLDSMDSTPLSARQNITLPNTALPHSPSRIGKTNSRSTLLFSQLSLDASERYKKPLSPCKKANKIQPGVNGVPKGGATNRLNDLFNINDNRKLFAKMDIGNPKFRKMYKKVWVILYPVAFFGFCVFYFIAYFLFAEDSSLTKCQF